MAGKKPLISKLEQAHKLMRSADVAHYHVEMLKEKGAKKWVLDGYRSTARGCRLEALRILRSINNTRCQMNLF